jgi:hypothetical protein
MTCWPKLVLLVVRLHDPVDRERGEPASRAILEDADKAVLKCNRFRAVRGGGIAVSGFQVI